MLVMKTLLFYQEKMALGPDSVNMTCPKCQTNIQTKVETETSSKGKILAIVMCIFGYA